MSYKNGAGEGGSSSSAKAVPSSRQDVVEHLRTLILAEWEQFKQCAGNGDPSPKDRLRQKYRANRLEILRRDRSWIASNARKLLDWFASGSEVVPEKITPRLVPVETEEQQALFRLARYTWSLLHTTCRWFTLGRLAMVALDQHRQQTAGMDTAVIPHCPCITSEESRAWIMTYC
jgi:hypothetical protein